jgi:hypothetical protein
MSTFSQQRGISRTYISGLIGQRMSATGALNMLKSLGLGYRKTDFLADWREMKGLEAKADRIKYIPKKLKPTPATITTTSESLSKEYSYIYKVKGRDSITGADKEVDWRYATDDLLSIEEAEELIKESIEIPEYETEVKDYTVSVVGVKQSITL